MSSDKPRAVTLTLTRFAEPDSLVRQSLAHALAQEGVSGEVVFVEQQVDSAITADDFPGAKLELRIVRRKLAGLSAARNLALDEARHGLIMFLDADALAAPDYAAQLAAKLVNDDVAVAGARIVPQWPGNPPALAKARAVYDQYSLLDLGGSTQPYHRVVGAGFGVDMGKLPRDFRFDENLGRRDGRLFGGEESDFTTRARALGYRSLYVGSAVVTHLIEPERTGLGWIAKRLVYAGHGRAKMGGAPSPGGKRTNADWLLAPLYVPPYAIGWLWGKFSG
ncbi:glycosyltransferase [Pontixanthobacter sp. CEM42]|uniref:glycosyltransferase family 2 protein n=1 Tax=Pontixanthobacter sp. CEM42 TaxID=2792077 RepID=UPI001AE0C965|nr:glycosyltransferase [Pontixanthobacter sp. CEM42]